MKDLQRMHLRYDSTATDFSSGRHIWQRFSFGGTSVPQTRLSAQQGKGTGGDGDRGRKTIRKEGAAGERGRETSSKLVGRVIHPDPTWTVSHRARRPQPISFKITNTGLLACGRVCVDIRVCVCVRLCVIISVLDKLTGCLADFLTWKLCSRRKSWRNFHFELMCVCVCVCACVCVLSRFCISQQNCIKINLE